jgi:gamma-glutamyltranspeptidase / glutathione hydrolase
MTRRPYSQLHILSTILLYIIVQTFSQTSISAPSNNEERPPELSGKIGRTKYAEGKRFMAVTANPHATEAAYTMLNKGGSAIDAAIAAQLVLGLVEPQSSGIGGGALALSWQVKSNTLKFYDGRETAPQQVDENLFLHSKGKPMQFLDAAVGGTSVGVPGLLRMLELAHTREGKLPWSDLFKPAINLANEGFLISPRLYTLLARTPRVTARPGIKAHFFADDGSPHPIGHLLKNPAYAKTLTEIAQKGSEVFYTGNIANDIVNAVHNDSQPGKLSLADIAGYQPQIKQAVCAPYRQYKVCSAAPPSSGATVLGILGILQNFDLSQVDANSVQMIHLFSEASKLAFADRDTYIADTDFVSVPLQALLDNKYLKRRASLIGEKNLGHAKPGVILSKEKVALPYLMTDSAELTSTSHLSIADAEGNMISMTSSVENAFGSRIMVNGFLLNNQLTDFSFAPRNSQGKLVANRVEPNKRPRSSMTPTIVFNNSGTPRLLVGSPGGSRIIEYTARTIVYHLDKGLPIEIAIASPHIININRGLELESERFTQKTISALTAKGHTVTQRRQSSGLHAIAVTRDGYRGGADPRREGTAKGL